MLNAAILAFGRGFIPIAASTMSLGPQNGFILHRGIVRTRLITAIVTCLACDCILICSGVFMSGAAEHFFAGHVLIVLKMIGATYLFAFGSCYLWSAACGRPLSVMASELTRGKAVLAAIGVSLLNPMAYVETMLVPAGLGAGLGGQLLPLFAAGAIVGACAKFCVLGLAAARMERLFSRRSARRMFDLACGAAMSGAGGLMAAGMLLPS